MKVIEALNNGIVTEHFNEAFKDVLALYQGTNVTLKLCRYDESKTGIGWEFKDSAIIGNCLDNLSAVDYYAAYDKIY